LLSRKLKLRKLAAKRSKRSSVSVVRRSRPAKNKMSRKDRSAKPRSKLKWKDNSRKRIVRDNVRKRLKHSRPISCAMMTPRRTSSPTICRRTKTTETCSKTVALATMDAPVLWLKKPNVSWKTMTMRCNPPLRSKMLRIAVPKLRWVKSVKKARSLPLQLPTHPKATLRS
jgi:hypothetical protein